MKLYIDPGTGSMMFALLIGLLGIMRYFLKGFVIKLKYYVNNKDQKETKKNKTPLVVFSDDKRYWQVFEPIIRELNNRQFPVTYLTFSDDDPGLQKSDSLFTSKYIGKGNKAFSKLNFLDAILVLSTTPGLDVYQWKRSKDVKYYIHIPHMVSELTTYKMFGTAFYDSLLLSAKYQLNDCRELEKVYGLPEKECVIVGIPYLDEKLKRLKKEKTKSDEITILVAPSWGKNSLLNRFGKKLIDELIKTGYKIVIRPHPQSFQSEKELLDDLMISYPDLEWNRDTDNFDVLNKSDLMVSDFSGVIFDYVLVFDKPVISTYENFDKSQYDAWWLDTPIWSSINIPKVGPILTERSFPNLKEMINNALKDKKYENNRREIQKEAWSYKGEGAKRAADFLIHKYLEVSQNG